VIFTFFKFLQFLNVAVSIVVTRDGMTIVVRLLHPSNAYDPIEFTLRGSVIDFKLVHPEKADDSMMAMFCDDLKITELKLLQPLNMLLLIVVTCFGIVMDFKLRHPSYALLPMLVTLSEY